MPSIAITPGAITPYHSGPIHLQLAGTGTTFTGGSFVSIQDNVSGLTTTNFVSWTANTLTSATLVVTTGGGSGTFTVTVDGTVSAPVSTGANSISATPSSLTAGTSPVAVAVIGVNTTFPDDGVGTAFSLSGGTGASISGTPTASDNTNATVHIIPGTAAATLTLTYTPSGGGGIPSFDIAVTGGGGGGGGGGNVLLVQTAAGVLMISC